MPRVHFLNVRNGDCSIIQHGSGRVSVIDVSCASSQIQTKGASLSDDANVSESYNAVPGNFCQKAHPDNPIEYLHKLGVSSIFRFVVTHPDMDHLDGIEDLFKEFSPQNFWDTANTKELADASFGQRDRLRTDWNYYKRLRDSNPQSAPKRLVYYSGDVNEYYKSDGLSILAPTPELIDLANSSKDWNDSSYVILFRSNGKKILFSGDSENKTWKHILQTWPDLVKDIDVLIAPHHGRTSGRDYTFLDVTKPRLTLFGNASSDHLMYNACRNRRLPILTNNQAGYIVLDIDALGVNVYIKNETFANKNQGCKTFYSQKLDAWYWLTV